MTSAPLLPDRSVQRHTTAMLPDQQQGSIQQQQRKPNPVARCRGAARCCTHGLGVSVAFLVPMLTAVSFMALAIGNQNAGCQPRTFCDGLNWQLLRLWTLGCAHCSECDPTCKECRGRTASHCTACPPGRSLALDGMCNLPAAELGTRKATIVLERPYDRAFTSLVLNQLAAHRKSFTGVMVAGYVVCGASSSERVSTCSVKDAVDPPHLALSREDFSGIGKLLAQLRTELGDDLETYFVISNGNGSGGNQVVLDVIYCPERTWALAQQVTNEAVRHNVSGVALDFEGPAPRCGVIQSFCFIRLDPWRRLMCPDALYGCVCI